MALTVLVVPCYNEAGRLHAARFERFAERHADVRFVLVDDGSTDASVEILCKEPLAGIDVIVLRLSRNFGHQAAIAAGLAEASADVVAVMIAGGVDAYNLAAIGYEVTTAILGIAAMRTVDRG